MQGLYEISNSLNIYDYLITSKELACYLESDSTNQYAKEKLLVHEDAGDLNLSLYLDEEVVNHFELYDPLTCLDHTNVKEFCLAVEGISHFVYLTWNAVHNRSVTLMEMELQAEVDKFIIMMQYLDQQTNHMEPGRLRRLLFGSTRFHENLDFEKSRRYRDASFYAEKYCCTLEERFCHNMNSSGLLKELRRFYRLGKTGKIKHIDKCY